MDDVAVDVTTTTNRVWVWKNLTDSVRPKPNANGRNFVSRPTSNGRHETERRRHETNAASLLFDCELYWLLCVCVIFFGFLFFYCIIFTLGEFQWKLSTPVVMICVYFFSFLILVAKRNLRRFGRVRLNRFRWFSDEAGKKIMNRDDWLDSFFSSFVVQNIRTHLNVVDRSDRICDRNGWISSSSLE